MKRIKVLKAYFITWLFILYIVYSNADLLSVFFMATIIFSTAIVGLLVVGTLYQIVSGFDIMMLGGTFGALAYKKTGYEFYIRSIDSLLPANIAHMLQSRKSQQKMLFTQDESRNIIEWLEDKFRKQKSYINFFINTSMLVGLLGTFVGLVEAIDSMGQIILGLNGDVDIKQIMQDFSGPLSGMAIGFGASLFGVVSAVVLGLNGYILFRSQDTLINGIEDWLKDRIIDLMPEKMGQSTVSAETLPEQRKTFMDVFLEQMTNFSGEVARLTKSQESLLVMSETLLGIKATVITQKESLQSIVELHENYNSKFDSFSRNFEEFYTINNDHRIEDRTLVKGLFENNSQALKEAEKILLNINGGITNLDRRVENQQETMSALVSITEFENQKNEQMHFDYIETIHAVDSSIKNETKILLDIASTQDLKSDKISHLLSSVVTKLSGIETIQEKELLDNERMHGEQKESIESVISAVKHETQALIEFSTTQAEKSDQIAHIMASTFSILSEIDRKNDKEQQEIARTNTEFLEVIEEINSSIKNEIISLENFANLHDEHAIKTSNILSSTLNKLSEIDTKILHNGEALQNIKEIQKSHLDTNIQASEKMYDMMQKVNGSVQQEILAFESFTQMQMDRNQKIVQNQIEAVEFFKAISITIEKVREILSVVLSSQDTAKEESRTSSNNLLGVIREVTNSLHTNRKSLEAILDSQGQFSTQSLKLQNNTLEKLQTISEAILTENQTSNNILKTSQIISNTQISSLEESLKAYDNFFEELSKIEQLTTLYSQERRSFEETYFQRSEEKQNIIIEELSKKIEVTQLNVEAMVHSLQNIEQLMSKFENNNPFGNSKVSGFFSSLFGKN